MSRPRVTRPRPPHPGHLPRGAPVEEDIGLGALHHRLVDLGDILVIELVPLPVDHVLAVGDVVAACGGRGGLVTDAPGAGARAGAGRPDSLPAVPWWQMTERRS